MKQAILLSFLLAALFACNSKAPNYAEQLESIFIGRISRIDSTVSVDSFKVISMQPITAQLGLQVEDSIYKTTYYKVVNQLNNAKGLGFADSIAFYQEELTYMAIQLDSYSRWIAKADSTNSNYGKFAVCSYQIRRGEKRRLDTAYFFFDRGMTLVNTKGLDSLIRRSLNLVR